MATKTVDRMILVVCFRPTDDELASVFCTTWTELLGEHLIEEANRHGPVEYRLTGAGWVAGLRLAPIWHDVEFRRKAGRLSESLKRHIKGRELDGALVQFKASSEEFVGDGERQRAVFPRNRRNISQVVSKDACCSWSACRRSGPPYRIISLRTRSTGLFLSVGS